MVFNKQGSTDGNDKNSTISNRSFHVSINERKPDEASSFIQENSLSTVSKLLPMQPDNIPMNIGSRYDATSLNRPLAIVRTNITTTDDGKRLLSLLFSAGFKCEEVHQVNCLVFFHCHWTNTDDRCELVDSDPLCSCCRPSIFIRVLLHPSSSLFASNLCFSWAFAFLFDTTRTHCDAFDNLFFSKQIKIDGNFYFYFRIEV